MAETQFTEVLQIQIDVAAFTNYLQQIEAEYDKFIERLNAKPISQSIATTTDFVTLSNGLSDVVTAVNSLSADIGEKLSAAFGAVSDSVEKLRINVRDALVESEKDVQQTADNLQRTAAKTSARTPASDEPTTPNRTPVGTEEAVTTEEFTKNYQIREAAALKVEQAIAQAHEASQALLKATDNQTTAEFDKNYQQKLAIASRIERQLATLHEQAQARLKSVDSETTADFDKAYQARVQAASRVEKELANLHASNQAELKAADTESTAAFVRGYQIRAEAAANLEKELAKVKAANEELAEQNQSANATVFERMGAAIREEASKLPETIVNVGKFLILWRAIGEIINGVVAAITALPRAIVAGTEFLAKMQETAAELRAVIAQNFALADNFKERFALAGQASEEVVEALRRKSSELGLDFEKVVVTFKVLSESGAGGLVQNLREVIQLTTDIELAARAITSDQQESRRIQQEIPQLLDGSITPAQSRLLHALQISGDEWERILDSARKNHDLLPQLEQRLQAFVEAGRTLPDTFENLQKQIKNTLSELEGSVAKTSFEAMIPLLQQIDKFLKTNQAEIAQIAELMGAVVVHTVEFVAVLLKLVSELPGVRAGFKAIGLAILESIALLDQTLNSAIFLGKVLADIGQIDLSKPWASSKVALDQLRADYNQYSEQVKRDSQLPFTVFGGASSSNNDKGGAAKLAALKKELAEAQQAINSAKTEEESAKATKAYKGLEDQIKATTSATKSFLDTDTTTSFGPLAANVRAVTQVFEEAQRAIKSLKTEYDDFRDKTRADIEARKTSVAAGEAAILKSYDDEINGIHKVGQAQQDGIKDRIDKAKSNLFNDPTLDVDERNKRIKELSQQEEDLLAQAAKGRNEEIRKINANAFAQAEAAFREHLENIKSRYRQAIDEQKELEATHVKTVREAADTRKQLRGKEFDEIRQLVDSAEAQFRRLGIVRSDTIFNDLRKTLDQAKATEAGGKTSDTRDVARNEAALDKVHYQEQLALQKQFNQASLNLARELHSEGILTDLEFFDRERELYRQNYELERQILVQEAANKAIGEVAQREALSKLAQLDQAYTQSTDLASRQRVEIARREAEQRAQFQVRLLQLQAEEKQDQLRTAQDLGASSTTIIALNRSLIQSRLNAITAALQEARAELAIAQAKNQNSEATRRLILQVEELQRQERQLRLQQAQGRNVPGTSPTAPVNRASTASGLTQEINRLKADVQAQIQIIAQLNQQLQDLHDRGLGPMDAEYQQAQQAIKEHTDAMTADAEAEQQHEQELATVNSSLGQFANTLADAIFGAGNLQKVFDSSSSAYEKAVAGVNGFANALGNIQGIINQFKQGQQQGGTLGGIGSLLSSGPISEALQKIPVVGQFIPAIGGIFSFIGGLFTAAARHIAEQIKKEIDQIETNYSEGQKTLQQTIKALQQERESAIERLSGKKGGQDELKKILPDLDKEIASLKQQQKQVQESFEQSLAILQTGGSAVLQNWEKDWININKQVKDYLDAVGAAGNANAQAFLDLSLQQERLKLQDQLRDAQLDAVNDAIALNGLLTQRNQLEKDYAAQKFAILSADSIERRQSSAITAGQQLAALKKQHDQQVSDLDFQIKQATQKVDVERQVFNIASDTASLQNQSLQLQLQQVQEQKKEWLDIQNILKQTAGLTAVNGSFPGQPFAPGTGSIPGITTTPAGPLPAPLPKTDVAAIAAQIIKDNPTLGNSVLANTVSPDLIRKAVSQQVGQQVAITDDQIKKIIAEVKAGTSVDPIYVQMRTVLERLADTNTINTNATNSFARLVVEMTNKLTATPQIPTPGPIFGPITVQLYGGGTDTQQARNIADALYRELALRNRTGR